MKKSLLLASTTFVVLTGLSNSLGSFSSENNPTNSLLAHESPIANSPDGIMSREESHQHKTREIPAGQLLQFENSKIIQVSATKY